MIEVRQRPYMWNFSGNSVFYELFSPEAQSDPAINFEVEIHFRRADEISFASITNIPLIFTPVKGTALINISDLLDSRLEFEVPPIQSNEKNGFVTGKQTGKFFIKMRIINADGSTSGWDETEQDHQCWVVKGGIETFRFKGNNFWINYFFSEKPALTWQLPERIVSLNERMYLAWLHTVLYSGVLRLKVFILYTDGSTAENQFDFATNHGQIIYVPVGAMQLGLQELNPGKKILHWEVQLGAQNGLAPFDPLMRKYRYVVDNRNDYNNITINYRNSLGGLDSVRIRGEYEEQAEYEVVESQRILGPAYFADTVLPAEQAVADSREQIIYKGSIIQLTREEHDRLRDLFIQREAYWMQHNRWWPVKIVNKNFRLRGSKDKRFGIPIEWQIAIEGNRFYTPNNVELGEGVIRTNLCEANIASIFTTVTFDGSIAKAKHAITLNIPAGVEVPKIQWWIPGFVDQKQDHWLYNGLEFTTTHAIGKIFTIYIQTVCKDGLEGEASFKTFSTNNFIPPPVAVPGNHRIINNTGVATPVIIETQGGEIVFAGDLPRTGSLLLPASMIGASYPFLSIKTALVKPSSGTLVTEGVTISAVWAEAQNLLPFIRLVPIEINSYATITIR